MMSIITKKFFKRWIVNPSLLNFPGKFSDKECEWNYRLVLE